MKSRLSAIYLLAAFGASQADAIPSAYVSKHGSLFIDNTTNSTLLRDTEKSQTVWVLPPSAGKTEFKGLVPSANLGFCSGIKNLIVASNSIEARIARLAQKQEELEPEYKEAEEALIQAQTEFGKVAASTAIKDLVLMEDSVATLEDNRNKLLESLETCTESCVELRDAYKAVSDEIRSSKDELRNLRNTHRVEVRAYNLAQAKVDAAENAFDTVGKRYDRIKSKLTEISAEVFQLFANKGRLEGGIAKIDYSSGWDEAINKLESDYAQYDFKAIPTSNVHINANIVGAASEQSYYESLPMLLDYTINGTKYVPWGDTNHQETALPAKMGGNLRLSTLGACPLADQSFFNGTGFTPELGASSAPVFAISATYQYPVAFKFKVKASYNLYKFYEMIKEQGKKGGFFSSSSYSKVLETKLDKDSFHIDWLVEDPDSKYDAETRAQIRAELKKSLMNRVLQTIAQPVVPGASKATFMDPGVPPEPGAIVFANGLQKVCGFNIYCQAGSWVLRGLTGIFGSSKTEQTFRSTWDRTAEESWSAETASYRSGIVSYAR